MGLYQAIAPYGNANARIVHIQIVIASIDIRLQQIDRSDNGGLVRQLLEKAILAKIWPAIRSGK